MQSMMEFWSRRIIMFYVQQMLNSSIHGAAVASEHQYKNR